MAEEKKQISLEVDADRKQRWMDYVEEDPDAASLSHLIRLSVETHIHDAPDFDPEELIQTVEETHGELDRKIRKLEDKLDTVHNRVKDDPYIEELKADIYDALPRLSTDDIREMDMEGGADDWQLLNSHPSGLSEPLDEDPPRIKTACNQLRIDAKDVSYHEENDTRFYYVEK